MLMNNNRRILVISNNCFSQSDSNGRTLGNLFSGWSKVNLAQLCVISKDPNWELCDNYFCLEDRVVLKAFLHCKKAEGRILHPSSADLHTDKSSTETNCVNFGKKTLSKILLRELVWSCKRWNSKGFQQWVEEFNPEAIVLQVGDTFFMIEIAIYLARTRGIPLLVYNTEGYFFFPRNWHFPSFLDSILFPFYKSCYSKKFCNLMEVASHSVYLNDMLQEDYDKQFGGPSSVIYNSSDLEAFNQTLFVNDYPRISYLGNLGLDRDSALIEVGDVLSQINPDFHIDIYGSADETMQHKFKNAKGVKYHGVVSYEKVKEVIEQSDILFHVESESGYKERQLQYAFSGKIADSISSGKCFILYGPKELACSKYIINTGAGWFVDSKSQLKDVIEDIMSNVEKRNAVLTKAKLISLKNHSLRENAQKFQKLLNTI